MAYDFNGSSQYLTLGSALATDEGITLACWFNPDAVTASMTLISLGNNGASGFFRLGLDGSAANDPILASKQNDTSTAAADSLITNVSVGTWHHAGAVFASNTSRTAYYDGTAGTGNTTSITDPTCDFTAIGALRRSSVSNYFDGKIADAAIWTAALTAAEMAALADGMCPLQIRPASLVAYLPLVRSIVDWKGLSWTNTGTATVAVHPTRVFYPKRRWSSIPTAATAITLSGPSSGLVNTASTNFTVGANGYLSSTVTVTPTDSSGQGSFTPSTVQITPSSPTATFTYTPTTTGSRNINCTDDGGLTDPSNVAYNSQAAATAVTLSGPSSGYIGFTSTNFTVGFDGAITGTVVVTPVDSSGSGTFTPTSLSLTSSSPTGTFTYTPSSTGARTISTSDNAGLLNTQTVTYTSLALDLATQITTIFGAATNNGYWKCDESAGATTLVDTLVGKDLTLTGGYTLGVTGMGQGTAISFNGTTGYAYRNDCVLGATLPSAFTVHAVVKAMGTLSAGEHFVAFGNSGTDTPFASFRKGTEGPTIKGYVRNDANTETISMVGTGIGVEQNHYHQIIWRYDGTNTSCWIDGEKLLNEESATIGTTTLNRTSIAALLRGAASGHAEIAIQHVAMCDVAITDAEIATLFAHSGITPWREGPLSFDFISRSNPVLSIGTIQGVGHDLGSNYFVTDTAAAHKIYRFTRSGTAYTQQEVYDATADMPVGATQINGIDYYDSCLWVGVNNFSTTTPKAGWIMKFSTNPIAYVATYSVGANWCEGGAWQDVGNGAEFWAIYHDLGATRRYDSAFNLIGQYTLPLTRDDTSITSERGLYQGAQWYTRANGDKFLLTQTHAVNLDTRTDIHKWTGSAFTAFQVVAAVDVAVGQSLHWETASPTDGSVMAFAERVTSAMTIVRATFGDASATAITMSASASSCTVGDVITITIAANGEIDVGATVTATLASDLAGTFSDSTPELIRDDTTGLVTYTPTVAGIHTISLTNDGGLTNPAVLTVTVSASSGGSISTGGGTSGRLRGRKPTIIRFSDFAARNEYEKALKQAIEESEIIVREPFSAKVDIKPLPNVLVSTNINIEQAIQEREQQEDEEKIIMMLLAMSS